MKKIFCSFYIIGFLFIIGNNIGKSNVFAKIESNYVKPVEEVINSNIDSGVTLHKEIVKTLFNGDSTRGEWNDNTVQWVECNANSTNTYKTVVYGPNSTDNWSLKEPTLMAKEYEKSHPGWIVLAGVNGDFYKDASSTNTKEPTNVFVQEGFVLRPNGIPAVHRGVFGVNEDNSYQMGLPTIDSNMTLHIYTHQEKEYEITQVNQVVDANGITLLTKDIYQQLDLTDYTVYIGHYDLYRKSDEGSLFLKGTIVNIKEGETAERPTEQQEFYLVSKQQELKNDLVVGTTVVCQYDLNGEWENVQNTVGFNYYVVEDGRTQHQAVSTGDSHIYIKYPRTLLGYKADGSLIMMCVDGKGTPFDQKVGVTLFEAGELMRLAGATYACNLDSGGSVNLFVRNRDGEFEIINRPSDGHERAVANAVFIVARDPGLNSKYAESTP
ncbi:MAG: phosphodiester glycosidase family protein, partial [Anaeroplasma bactoclasticum]|nr:phosphodiester glycosidase family protein [Anaeroplasma bactoclasticum]